MDRAIDADLVAHEGIHHPEFEVLLRLWWDPDQRMRLQDLAAQSHGPGDLPSVSRPI